MEREDVELCRNFTLRDWKSLRGRLDDDEPKSWTLAIDVFERRMKERFLSSIELLRDGDSGSDVDVPEDAEPGALLPEDAAPVVVPGFAMVALCCLLAEALQSFRRGASTKTEKQFTKFLGERPAFGGAFADPVVARSFFRGVRNGILHEAETRKWVIGRDRPSTGLVKPLGSGRYALNRTAFYEALRDELEQYITSLREGEEELRRHFLEQMDDMVSNC